MKIFDDFESAIKGICPNTDIIVYLNKEIKIGENDISNKQLEEYNNYDTPKYIVSDNPTKPLIGTNNVLSRFVYNTTTSTNNNLLFILSSYRAAAFETNSSEILSEMLKLKSYFE
ncbi:MAG: hypothetical protein RSB38_00245 [Oscillospiraceae bacterium]